MAKMLKISRAPLPGGMVGLDDAAAYLGIKSGTLRNWVSQKRIPFYKVGSLTKFRLADLDDYLQRHRVKAVV